MRRERPREQTERGAQMPEEVPRAGVSPPQSTAFTPSNQERGRPFSLSTLTRLNAVPEALGSRPTWQWGENTGLRAQGLRGHG